jgi:cytochrome c553
VNKILLLALLTLGLPAAAVATEEHAPAAQIDKLLPLCQSCHGDKGAKPILPEYPVLAGQYTDYIEHTLKDYRAGKRSNPVMKAQAATLSDADIKALARYFSQQESPLYTPSLPTK